MPNSSRSTNAVNALPVLKDSVLSSQRNMPSAERPSIFNRIHSNFKSRTATDDAGELTRRFSRIAEEQNGYGTFSEGESADSNNPPRNPYEPDTNESTPPPHEHALAKRLFHLSSGFGQSNEASNTRGRSASRPRRGHVGTMGEHSLTGAMRDSLENKKQNAASIPKPGLGPRPIGGDEKLGIFSGVYVPTCLNVLSILMFLRFGFILGQGGVLGIMGMLIASYAINLVTTFSLSAIASNGTVRGGGAYYLISRSLGPEFGGSIGVVFYLGFVFNTGMNAGTFTVPFNFARLEDHVQNDPW